MHWHRIFQIFRWSVGYRSLVLFLFWSISTLLSSEAHSKTQKSLVVDKYIESAFANTATLMKFLGTPRPVFVCGDTQLCADAFWFTRNLIPNEIQLAFSGGKVESKFNLIVFTRTNDDEKNWNEFSANLDTKQKSSGDVLQVIVRGDDRCSSRQYVKENEVQELIIVVSASEGSKNNSICIMYELMRGSGASSQTHDYGTYSKQIADLGPDVFLAMQKGVTLLLRVHFSSFLKAGMDRSEATASLKANLDN
jgi:hypothetical protein